MIISDRQLAPLRSFTPAAPAAPVEALPAQPSESVQLSTPQRAERSAASRPAAPAVEAAPAAAVPPAPAKAAVPAALLMEEPAPLRPSQDPDDPRFGLRCDAFLRPDPLFADATRLVVHTEQAPNNPGGIAETRFGKFPNISTDALLSRGDQVLIGFGQPKVTTVVPRADGDGYQKLNAAPFFKRDARVERADTLQSGVFLRPRNLPTEAVDALRSAMADVAGHRSLSTARANAQVLSQAGFTSGGKKISCQALPLHLFMKIAEKGLEYKGQPVRCDIINTTPNTLDQHFRKLIKSEIASVASGDPADTPAQPMAANSVASPKMEADDPNAPRLHLRNSRPGVFSSLVRSALGAHVLYEAIPNPGQADINKFLPTRLKDKFSDDKPLTDGEKKKKKIFSPGTVSFLRKNIARSFDDTGAFTPRQIVQMLRQPEDASGKPLKYNIVICGDNSERGNRVVIARLKINDKENKADDVLSKHVLISGYDQDVRFAGECWAERYTKEDGSQAVRFHVSNNSGTYRPPAEATEPAAEYLRQVFPGVDVVAHPGTPKAETAPDYLQNFALPNGQVQAFREGIDGKVVTLKDQNGVGQEFKIRGFKSVEFDTEFFDTKDGKLLDAGAMLRARTRYKQPGVADSKVKDVEIECKVPAKDSAYDARAKGYGFDSVGEWRDKQTMVMTGEAGDNAVRLAQTIAGDAPLQSVAEKNSMRELYLVSPTDWVIGRFKPSFLVMIDKNQMRATGADRPSADPSASAAPYHTMTSMLFTKLPWTKEVTPERVARMEDLGRQLSNQFGLHEVTESAFQEGMAHL